jgi:hypothetical protein
MKNLTTSVYTFEDLLKGKFLYVDKTETLWKMLEPAKGIYFLSRPRRFGKSLTLSTLKAVFQNKKHLFKGLALENKPHAWKEYPVIHLDLGSKEVQSQDELKVYLSDRVNKIAADYNVKLSTKAYDARFQELIETLGKPGKIVILIDEYDKPILDNVTNKSIKSIRETLESFYSVIKATEPYQRFVLLTGVSKFSKVSVFSKLNNLTDITMDARFATMLGYTQEEFESNFAEHIEHVCREQKMDKTELLVKLKLWYDGYRFEEDAEPVYNPVSIGKFFESGGKFKNYWFETGTPSFLLKLAKKQQFDFEKELTQPVSELAFASYEIDKLETLPLLFQTGYLTIKNAIRDEGDTFYHLDFPNREVEAAFEAYLLNEYSGVKKERIEVYAAEMTRMLKGGDIDGFMGKMKIFFADIPYDIQVAKEKYYQTIFYIVFRLIGLRIEAEARTSIGRIDAVAQTEKYVYIFEFKLNRSSSEALRQIHDKEYYQKYLGSGREIILIGAKFSTKKHNIADWKTEVLPHEII